MNKLPRNVKGKQLVVILERLGFRIVGKRGSHIRLSHPDGPVESSRSPSKANSSRNTSFYSSTSSNNS